MIRYSRRGPSERGFALITAILLSILALTAMELAMRDATDRIRHAHRFRSRISSQILADNAAELAAARMIEKSSFQVDRTGEAGEMAARYTRLPGNRFEIEASGVASGVTTVRSAIVLRGVISGASVRITESETH